MLEVISHSRRRNGEGASEPDVSKLARLIRAYAPHDGTFELRIPGLHASRVSKRRGDPCCPT
jgi:hypothetical protein